MSNKRITKQDFVQHNKKHFFFFLANLSICVSVNDEGFIH